MTERAQELIRRLRVAGYDPDSPETERIIRQWDEEAGFDTPMPTPPAAPEELRERVYEIIHSGCPNSHLENPCYTCGKQTDLILAIIKGDKPELREPKEFTHWPDGLVTTAMERQAYETGWMDSLASIDEDKHE